MTRRRHSGERGFALIETLVAVAVIAVMMGLFYQMVASDARVTAAVRARRQAALLAQSVLDQAGSPAAALSPVMRGESDGLAWRIERAPYRDGAQSSRAALERIVVTVAGANDGKQLLRLDTLRLVR